MPKLKAIGIDFGTSKCCVGVVCDGRVEILENERGNKTTPSYVAFTDTERLVGEDAKDQAALNTANTVLGVKSFMCKELKDSTKRNPINAINVKGETCFQVAYMNNLRTLLSQQISAMLLTKMKSLAEDHLKSSVEEAVISVPASFSNAKRQALKDAAAIAGLKVLALINEPTAAAISYQANRRSKGKENIVVVDFGAGKLDVSVVSVDDGCIQVKGVSGSTDIGGNDVDEILMSHIIDKYKEKFNDKDPTLDRGVRERLRSSCENIKKKISLLPKVQETLDCFGEKNKLQINMSKDTFNNMLPEKFRKCLIDCLEDSLRVAAVDQKGISRVLLVGGSTRLLPIQEWLKKRLQCPIDRSVNPDEAVAVGAAVQAALLSGDHEVKELVVQDAIGTKFFLMRDGDPQMMDMFRLNYLFCAPSNVYSLKNDVLMKKHTYHVYEEFIGRKNLPSSSGSFSYSSDLCCRVDRCGIFSVGTSVGTNRDGSYELSDILQNVPGKLPTEELRKLVGEEVKFRQDDQAEKRRTEAMSNLKSFCLRRQSDIQNIKLTEYVPKSIDRLATKVEECINWLNFEPRVGVSECHKMKNILEQECSIVLEEFQQHKVQVVKERVAAAAELGKGRVELPFTLTDGDKTLKELGLLATRKAMHSLSKEECVEYITALQKTIDEHENGERHKGAKASANDTRLKSASNGVLPAGSSVDKSNWLLMNTGYPCGS